MKSKDLSEIKSADLNDKVRQWFERFSGQCSGSKMYQQLSNFIAKDTEILSLAAQGNQTQPIPNLFLAAIHFLLLKNNSNLLATFYPSLGGTFVDSTDFYKAFKNFAINNSEEIIQLITTRTVQTNEVRRCAQLMAGLSMISEKIENRPITLIDIGTSSGLNLLMDQYNYSYNEVKVGNPKSELLILCQVKGTLTQVIKVPQLARRIGIDLNPIDLSNPEESLWAKALVWPDQIDRIERLDKAISIRRLHNFEMHKTIGNEVLESILSNATDSDAICVMHSFTLNQFSEKQRNDFQNVLLAASVQKPIWRLSLEWIGTPEPELKAQLFHKGRLEIDSAIASCHGHGEWIEFKNVTLG